MKEKVKNESIAKNKADPRGLKVPQQSPDSLRPIGVNVDPTPSASVQSSNACLITRSERALPPGISQSLNLVICGKGQVHLVVGEGIHKRAVPVQSKRGRSIIRNTAEMIGSPIKKTELNDVLDTIIAYGEEYAERMCVHHRIAPIAGGIELYLGDVNHTRVRVTAGTVEVLRESSDTLFCPSPVAGDMPVPLEQGCIEKVAPFLNTSDVDRVLLLGWLTYTLAHPKAKGSKYVHLVVSGDQGSGKSTLCNLLLALIDPTVVGIQALPSKVADLSLILQHSHVVCFDNVRYFNSSMSDYLCMASTGGALSNRALYTDSDVSIKRLHGACIFNGIHSFITQSDLAQRCLTVYTRKLEGVNRKTESEILEAFERDWPEIFRGLLDLIAEIFKHLPNVEVANPERMIEFSRWLGAMEMARGVPQGVYQADYSYILNQAQLNTLMENTLAAALVEFSEGLSAGKWKGAPAELLEELNIAATKSTIYSRSWPKSPIALGKRLQGLKAGLSEQGIHIESSRGKNRVITISVER